MQAWFADASNDVMNDIESQLQASDARLMKDIYFMALMHAKTIRISLDILSVPRFCKCGANGVIVWYEFRMPIILALFGLARSGLGTTMDTTIS